MSEAATGAAAAAAPVEVGGAAGPSLDDVIGSVEGALETLRKVCTTVPYCISSSSFLKMVTSTAKDIGWSDYTKERTI